MRKLVLAVGVPVMLTAGVTATTTAASTPPTTPEPGVQPDDGDFVLPDGWTWFVDDTNTITLAVPNDWTDTDTAPRSNPDGTLAPRITAATDLGVFVDTFDAPGVDFWARTYADDPQVVMDSAGLRSGCRRKNIEPYDDGAFVGLHGVWESCGSSGAATWHQVVASPASQSFTFVLQIQIPSEDQSAIVEDILASFNFTPEGATVAGPLDPSGPAVPSTALGASSTTVLPSSNTSAPTTTVAPLPLVSGTVAPDARLLFDDLGVLSVSVPAEWTVVDTEPLADASGNNQPWISATTDSALFFPPEGTPDTFSVPGVLYVAFPHTTNLESTLARYDAGGRCIDEGTQPYSDGVFTGLARVYSDCGGIDTRIILVAANPIDDAYTMLLLLQLTTDSTDGDYDTVMSSFTMVAQNPGSGGSSSTIEETPTTTT